MVMQFIKAIDANTVDISAGSIEVTLTEAGAVALWGAGNYVEKDVPDTPLFAFKSALNAGELEIDVLIDLTPPVYTWNAITEVWEL